MATIDELMKDKKPGEIKIRGSGWARYSWFQPYYFIHDYWYGPSSGGYNQDRYTNSGFDWLLYTEPKPKVTLFEFIYFDAFGWFIDPVLRTESKAGKYYDDRAWGYRKTGRSFEVDAE